MSTPSLEDVLAQHRPTIASGGFTDCRCGKNLDEKGSWAAHVAEVIRERWHVVPNVVGDIDAWRAHQIDIVFALCGDRFLAAQIVDALDVNEGIR